MSTAVPGFDLSPEEKAPHVEAMAIAARRTLPGIDDVTLSIALAAVGNALLAALTADQCERLAAAKRRQIH